MQTLVVTNLHRFPDGRTMIELEADIPARSSDQIWDGSGVDNAVFRFVAQAPEYHVGQRFRVSLIPLGPTP